MYGTIIVSSQSGLNQTWQQKKSWVNSTLRAVISANGLTVIVGESGTILTSTDLETWTRQTSGTNAYLTSVIWDGERFIAGGLDGSPYVVASTDGTAWTPLAATEKSSAEQHQVRGLAVNSSRRLFCVGKEKKSGVIHSLNSTNNEWELLADFTNESIPNGIALTFGKLIVVNYNGLVRVSDDDRAFVHLATYSDY